MIYSLYGGDVELEFDEKKHVYRVDGEIDPSATGVCGIIDKSGPLMWWAVGQCVDFFGDKLDLLGEMDEVERKQLLHDAHRAHLKASRKATDIGTLAHEWVEDYLAGNEPGWPKNRKLLSTCQSFVDWAEAHDVTPIETEFKIYSRRHRYAGTCDFDGYIDGERCIADWKTGRAVYPEHRLQTIAYKDARIEELGVVGLPNGEEMPKARWIVVLPKDGGQVIAERRGPEHDERDRSGFLGALDLYRSLK